MYIINSKKIAFFHNPKTGGRSIIEGFKLEEDTKLRLVHFSPLEARRCIFQEAWNDYFSFSFVRNPWERLVSLYEYHRSDGYREFLSSNFSYRIAQSRDFEEWIEFNISSKRKSNWFGVPQSNWTADLSQIYRFENFADAFADICERVGVKAMMPHLNASLRRPYREYYRNQKAIDAVAVIDAEIIRKFRYEY